jgi:hypothetical protein
MSGLVVAFAHIRTGQLTSSGLQPPPGLLTWLFLLNGWEALQNRPDCRLSALCALGRSARRQFFEGGGAGRVHTRPEQLFRYYWQDRTHGHRRSRVQPRLRSLPRRFRSRLPERGELPAQMWIKTAEAFFLTPMRLSTGNQVFGQGRRWVLALHATPHVAKRRRSWLRCRRAPHRDRRQPAQVPAADVLSLLPWDQAVAEACGLPTTHPHALG